MQIPGDLLQSVYAPRAGDRAWRLEELLGSPVRYFGLGRVALTQALALLGIRKGERVLLPELICREVVSGVEVAGGQPMFYPIGESLRMCGDPLQLPRARAIVAVNYFGFPQELEPFRSYCAATGAALIEDNAHGLFGRDEGGKWLGVRGDVGVFSLRKTLPLPNGGALALPSSSLIPLPTQIQFVPEEGRYRYRIKQGLRRTVPWLGHRPLKVLTGCLRRIRPANNGREPESPHPCSLLAGPLSIADPQQEVGRRRALYQFCHPIVTSRGGRPVFYDLPKNTSPYVYPFYAEGVQLKDIQRALDRAGLDFFLWPNLPKEIQDRPSVLAQRPWCVRFLW